MVLKKVFQAKVGLQLWQIENDLKITNRGLIYEIAENKNYFIINPQIPTTPFMFTPGVPLLFKEEKIEFVFKEEMVKLSPQEIILPIPRLIQFYYQRKMPRIAIPKDEKKEMVIRQLHQKTFKHLRLVDINLKGAGARYYTNQPDQLKALQDILITQIGMLPLQSPLKGRIVYVREVLDKSSVVKSFRMGIKFMNPLTNLQLTQILY